jgi:membrane-bound metal-dependent hydrolase YbcI (DUF457 family)
MPDLLTHLASARLPAAFLADRRLALILVLGTFLPDLAAKGLTFVAQAPDHFDVPTHSLPGLLVLCFGCSLFLEEPLRPRGFAALLAGAWLHVLVDLVKDYQGSGAARLFYPFSPASFELAWVNPENVVLLVPLDAAVLLLAWAVERRRRALR